MTKTEAKPAIGAVNEPACQRDMAQCDRADRAHSLIRQFQLRL